MAKPKQSVQQIDDGPEPTFRELLLEKLRIVREALPESEDLLAFCDAHTIDYELLTGDELPRPRSKPDPKRCTACWRLARLTPSERATEASVNETKKREALAKLRDKSNLEKVRERQHRMASIDAMRIDAMACLDAFQLGYATQRCRTWVLTDDPKIKIRCALEVHASGAHAINPDGSGHLHLADVLAAAVELYKLEHKSGGYKLVVLVAGRRECHRCGWVNEPDADTCADCVGTMRARGRADKRDVACRFCRQILGRNQDPFSDFSRAFFDPSGAEARARRDGSTDGVVDVWQHTVMCALRYLTGLKETNQDDAPVPVMPAESFVLEHDR